MEKLWRPTHSHSRKLSLVLRPFSQKKPVDDTGPNTAGDGGIAGASDVAPPEEMDGLVVAGGEHVDGTPMDTSGDDASTSSDTAVPELTDDLVAEILLRLRLDYRQRRTRISLVCKRWHGILSDPYFRSRFKEFHHSRLELRRRRRLVRRLGIMMVN
ncbi:hypothetical protein ACP70R_014589 [Stipagrostis hirtigluma subsp. patula]